MTSLFHSHSRCTFIRHTRARATIDRSIDRDDDATHRGCPIASVDAMRVVGATNDDDDANIRGSDDEATTEGG